MSWLQTRDKARREHNEQVRALVNFVRRRDRRLVLMKQAAKAERGTVAHGVRCCRGQRSHSHLRDSS